jgi:hypothetical protein
MWLELRGAISSDVKLSDCRLAFKQRSGPEGEPLGSPLGSFLEKGALSRTRRYCCATARVSSWHEPAIRCDATIWERSDVKRTRHYQPVEIDDRRIGT